MRLAASVAEGGSTHMVGVLHSTPSTTFELDFYANDACSNFPREFLEGKTYLGSGQVTTDASGVGIIDLGVVGIPEPGARISATATDPAGRTSEFSQRLPFATTAPSGPPEGGTSFALTGTDFIDGATVTIGGVAATGVDVDTFTHLTATTPALDPGTVNDIVVTNTDGSTGTLVKGYVSDFLDVPSVNIFYSYVTKLVSNGITAGVGGGIYGVTQDTLRQQMAVFLLKAKYGLCYTPPPCTTQVFDDVPCSLVFAPWINELVAEGFDEWLRYRQHLLPGEPGPPPADGRPPASDPARHRLHASRLHRRDLHRRPLLEQLRPVDLRPRRPRHHRRLRRRPLLPHPDRQPGPDGDVHREDVQSAVT